MKKLFSKLMLVTLAVAAFVACEDVPEPYDIPGTGDNTTDTNKEIEGATGDGTLANPFNAVAALNYGNNLASGEMSPDYMYIKGKVVSIKEEFTTQYGNGTFYISSDGSATNQFYAYRVNYLGNKKFATGDEQIKVGDEVIVCGKITNYNGTIETAQKEGFLYELNGVNRGGEPDSSSSDEGVATGDGTLENPFNSVAAIAYAKEVGDTESPKDVYIKGKVASITDQYGTQFGNATFTISDDGTASNAFTVYRALYLGNNKYTSGDLLKEGDEVIVYGKVTNFKGNTPETVQGKAYLYSLNGKTEGGGEEPNPVGTIGTADDPITTTKALDYINNLADGATTDQDAYVVGKITQIKTTAENIAKYLNIDYIISDGKTEITVFRGKNLNNTDFTAEGQINVGDEVVVLGKLQKYVNNSGQMIPEIAQGNYIVKLTKGGGGDDPNPQPGNGKGSGTQADPYDAIAAIAFAQTLEADKESANDIYVEGIISSIKYTYSAQYGTATYAISVDGKAENEFTVYGSYYFDNKSWVEGNTQIQKGDKVVVCGKIVNYMGNTPEFANKKNWLVSLNGKTSDEGSQQGGDDTGNGGGDVSGNTLTVVYGDLNISSLDNAIKLTDGTTLTFSQEDGKNPPIYHESTKIIRMYAHNSVTINAGSKKISSVAFAYDTYNGTAYKGNDEMYGEAGDKKITPAKDDKNVTFTNVNSSSLKVVNDFSTNSGGTQFRCTGLVITYAE